MSKEIVILTRSLPLHRLGGMEIIAWDFAREFVREGCEVRVITTSIAERNGCEFELDGVRVVPLENCPAARYTSSWWRESRAFFEANCAASALAVLSVSAAGFGLLPLKRRLTDIPFVMQAHGTSWAEVVSKWRSRRLRSITSSARNLLWLPRDMHAYGRFDAVIAVGEKVSDSLRSAPAKWFVRPESVHLISNGVDARLFRPDSQSRGEVRARLGIDEQVPVLISANRLHRQKGTHHCLEAVSHFARRVPEFRYVIAGDGPDQAFLQSAIRNYGLGGSVRMLGRVAREELAWWLRGADVLLFLTEHEEGLPLNVLEALATGVEVVASEHLRLFESSSIHRADPRDPEKVREVLGRVLAGRGNFARSCRLPPTFELQYAARQYLSVLGLRAD